MPSEVVASLRETQHGYTLTVERDGESVRTLIDADFWYWITKKVREDAAQAAVQVSRQTKRNKAIKDQGKLFG